LRPSQHLRFWRAEFRQLRPTTMPIAFKDERGDIPATASLRAISSAWLQRPAPAHIAVSIRGWLSHSKDVNAIKGVDAIKTAGAGARARKNAPRRPERGWIFNAPSSWSWLSWPQPAARRPPRQTLGLEPLPVGRKCLLFDLVLSRCLFGIEFAKCLTRIALRFADRLRWFKLARCLCHFFTFQPELDQAADLASDGSLDPGRNVGRADDVCADRRAALRALNRHRNQVG
jgi:hypothetical protein